MRKDFFPVAADSGKFQTSVLLDKLLTERDPARSCVSIELIYKCPHGHKTVAEVANSLGPVHILQINEDRAILEFANKNFACIAEDERSKARYEIKLFGDYDWAINFRELHSNVPERKGRIKWYYSRKGDIDSKTFEIEKPLPLYDAFYPYISGGIETYLDAYLAARPSILILMGPPGTGKTSLLRYLLWSRNLTAAVTFDETVIADEEYFIDFAADWDEDDYPGRASKRSDVMIVEDADLLLSARESEQNKTMAKLLNVSEGLIPLDRKKMVFTTNLPNINRIDPALIRPGRCFDVLHFRPLTNAEAHEAAKVAGLTFASDKKEVTLADLFHSSRTKEETERFKLLKTA